MKTTTEKRSASKSKIVRFIYDSGHTSKVEIAKELGLSMPTVLLNVRELEEEGLVVSIGEYQSTGGRKAKSLTLCREAVYSVGLDITANHISLVLINLAGEVVAQERKRKSFVYSLDYCNDLAGEVNAFIENFWGVAKSGTVGAAGWNKMLGVGISLPGIMNSGTALLLKSHALNLFNVSLKMIGQAMPLPVYYENDANAAMMAEADRMSRDCIYLSLSNTVGGAVCMNGEIFRGTSQKAGEFGHMILIPKGRSCYCGKRGCTDAYCSALVLAGHGDGVLETFMEKVDKKQEQALKVWEEYLDHLAIVITNLRMAYDTDIILGGYVGGCLDKHMLELGKKVMANNLFDSDISYLKTCSYQKEASAVGAAKYFIDDYIGNL